MGQIQGQGRPEESPLRASDGRDVCLWPHCVGSEFPEPLWPWPWGRALWMIYSCQSAQTEGGALQPKLLFVGKITSGIQPLPFTSNGYTALPGSVASFYGSRPWGWFQEKVVHCNRNRYSFFCETGNYLPMWVFLPWLHWQSGSNWNGSIHFLTFIQ